MIKLLITDKAAGYFKYGDGTLTVMGNSNTNIEDSHSKFTSICAIVSCKTEGECNKKTDFLDI
jgi:hypothetical protein